MSELTYGQLFDKSWNTIKSNLAMSCGLTLVYLLAVGVFNFVPFVGGFLSALMTPGYMYSLIRLRDQKNIEYQDFFWGFQDFNRLLHWLVMYIGKIFAIVLGLILLIIPGIYLAVSLLVAEPYFVFRNQDGIEALKASLKLTTQHWWFMFGLVFLLIFLNLVGAICFVIGLLVTVPMSVMILFYAMEALEKANPPLEGGSGAV